MVASQEMHLSHYNIICVLFAYLLGDLLAYTHWYGAMSVMTNQLCWCNIIIYSVRQHNPFII